MAIHPTALVSPKATVDPSAEIGPYAVIREDVIIGPGCRIHPHVHICPHTRLGRDNVVHTGAVLGDLPQDRAFRDDVPTYVEIGDRNVIREYVTIHRATKPNGATRIGHDCFLMAFSHVAHDCEVADEVILANHVLLAGHVHVGRRAFLSGYVGVHQFTRIGRLAIISGHTRVTMDVPPFLMAAPAQGVIGINRVGLRRAQVPADEISALRRAYRKLFRQGGAFRAACQALTAETTSPFVRELLDFIAAPSKRGIAGYVRRGRGLRPAADPEGEDE